MGAYTWEVWGAMHEGLHMGTHIWDTTYWTPLVSPCIWETADATMHIWGPCGWDTIYETPDMGQHNS